MDEHKFWKTQPIQDTSQNEKINKSSDITELNNNMFSIHPINLPENFFWYEIDPKSEIDINDLYNFLYDNYNYIDNKFGAHYTKESLHWYLSNPTYFQNMFLFVKYKEKVVGSIIGTPANISIFDKLDIIIDTSFLCISKKIREKSLASIMIKELLRRMYFNNVQFGYYTTHLLLPNILTCATYYHRPINIKKLVNIDFISKPSYMSMGTFEELYKTKDKLTLNLRKMNENDISQCTQKLNQFYKKYKIYQIYTEDEFKYKFLPQTNIIDSYVFEKDNNIQAFISTFYTKSRIFNNKTYSEYNIAQIYHYFYYDDLIFIDMINDILLLMKQQNIDVVNCLEQMDNHLFINKLNFKQGSGKLNFYFWNKKCPTFTNKDIALITL